MSIQVPTAAQLAVGSFNATSTSNMVDWGVDVAVRDKTTWGSRKFQEFAPTTRTLRVALGGFNDYAAAAWDEYARTNAGSAQIVTLAYADADSAGTGAIMANGLMPQGPSFVASVGDLPTIAPTIVGSTIYPPVAEGQVTQTTGTAITATANTPPAQRGQLAPHVPGDLLRLRHARERRRHPVRRRRHPHLRLLGHRDTHVPDPVVELVGRVVHQPWFGRHRSVGGRRPVAVGHEHHDHEHLVAAERHRLCVPVRDRPGVARHLHPVGVPVSIRPSSALDGGVAAASTGGSARGGAQVPTWGSLRSASDISSYVTGIQQEATAATLPVTSFGSGGFEAFVIGLKTGTLNLSLLNDYAAGALNSLIGVAGSVVPVGSSSLLYVEVRRTSSSRSSGNPGFICAVLNRNFQTFNASVGEVPTCAWNPQITGGYAELAA